MKTLRDLLEDAGSIATQDRAVVIRRKGSDSLDDDRFEVDIEQNSDGSVCTVYKYYLKDRDGDYISFNRIPDNDEVFRKIAMYHYGLDCLASEGEYLLAPEDFDISKYSDEFIVDMGSEDWQIV